jgi:hypothetical protein
LVVILVTGDRTMHRINSVKLNKLSLLSQNASQKVKPVTSTVKLCYDIFENSKNIWLLKWEIPYKGKTEKL